MADFIAPQPGQYEDNKNIRSVWDAMDTGKGDLIERSKEYARLTTPSICPMDNAGKTEQEHANVMIGPRCVNFLAHKLVNTMFPHDRPFFKIGIKPQVEFDLSKQVEQATIDKSKTDIEERGIQVARLGMSKIDMIQYRPVAIEAAKHLIVTGNAVIRRLPNTKRVVYGVKDFGIFRHIDGSPYDIIVRDMSRFDALDKNVQDAVRAHRVGVKPYDTVALYSRWRWDARAGKWEFTQAVDDHNLPTFSLVAEKDFPLIPLTWTLARGENYGRGLVEDNIAAFNSIDVSTTALLDLMGIAADIKFFVNPGSVIDIQELINSKRGTYHLGAEGDVSSPNVSQQKMADMRVMAESIANWERNLSAAFLMSSGSVRDAERVTAEEIRFYAKEIESAYGGLYSMLSKVWQLFEATWAISQIEQGLPKFVDVLITTGLDALSQESALDNLGRSFQMLAILNGTPPEVLGTLDLSSIARFIFMNNNLPFNQFTLSKEQMQERQAQQQAQMQQQVDMQKNADVSKAVAQGAAKQ